MKFLLPLGLLGLLSLAVLLLIYILRPNYQQKLVSSTYIWKLSLKYRKRRVPISRLRNLLILLLQILLLASLALMMARPALAATQTGSEHEKVAVIDASADMMTASENETRFERAIRLAGDLARSTLANEDGIFSVIIADEEAHFALSRLTAEDADSLESELVALGETPCGYGSADIDGAAALAQQVLDINPKAEVLLYTATEYLDAGSFRVVDVSGADDWNAAILGVTPVLSESNTYSFTVEAGCYGRSKPMVVTCELTGVNGNSASVLRATKTEYFTDIDSEKTIEFTASDFDGSGEAIVSFREMYVHVDEDDSLTRDNTFNVYGGTKQTLRIQYASSKHENFFWSALYRLRNTHRDYWNIEITEASPDNAKTEGFDFYIFEHSMPSVLPTDGVVLLADPDTAPSGSGLTIGNAVETGGDATLSLGQSHPISQYMDPARIPTVTQYRRIFPSDGYAELLYCNGEPILLTRNEPDLKVTVLALDFEQTDYSVTPDFPIMMYNLFDYYFPYTIREHSFEIGETIDINARGENVSLDGPAGKTEFTQLPAQITAALPGDYTVTQTGMNGTPIVEQFFVHIPAAESNIFAVENSLPPLYAEDRAEEDVSELAFWFACAALVLLLAEWLLHSRENL